ncbi:MmcQ/YjbR family DNA-binding protein [Roseovarius aestuariivivens]|uniref:MmcQ/YjbR family DNA-binding protein n=1 Tax=Roseovarius aestuariivivens TaxID=1888910 RepID=UPI00108109D2|nr:MmcQ/YjbR family DNA-binding protein [Roseovarius aestuariivivens]
MSRDAFNAYCAGLGPVTHVVQWGGADVWKIGGKVFAIAGWNDGRDAYTFKAGDVAFDVLADQPGIRPAPYLASRGLKWLQVHDDPGLSDEQLKEHVVMSFDMVVAGLSKKKRYELGFES